MNLDELIERLEKATGPSKSFDYWISATLRSGAILKTYSSLEGWVKSAENFQWNVADYTSSIDAALTLVPVGWCWKLIWEPAENFYRVVIRYAPKLEDNGLAFVTHGATASMALCLAALHARRAPNP